jgi:predicted MFS family arabinose efflux permease
VPSSSSGGAICAEASALVASSGLSDRLEVALASAAMAFSLVDRFALSLLFQPIKADLGLSDTKLGLLHGVAFGLFYAAMGLPLGWLADRMSRRLLEQRMQ